jgi:hypothetical protein
MNHSKQRLKTNHFPFLFFSCVLDLIATKRGVSGHTLQAPSRSTQLLRVNPTKVQTTTHLQPEKAKSETTLGK